MLRPGFPSALLVHYGFSMTGYGPAEDFWWLSHDPSVHPSHPDPSPAPDARLSARAPATEKEVIDHLDHYVYREQLIAFPEE